MQAGPFPESDQKIITKVNFGSEAQIGFDLTEHFVVLISNKA